MRIFVWALHDAVEIGPKMLTRIAKHTAVEGGGFVMPPDQLSTSLWKRALGFLRGRDGRKSPPRRTPKPFVPRLLVFSVL
jgi:hypothetical protein